jgi:hypothetical protein
MNLAIKCTLNLYNFSYFFKNFRLLWNSNNFSEINLEINIEDMHMIFSPSLKIQVFLEQQ